MNLVDVLIGLLIGVIVGAGVVFAIYKAKLDAATSLSSRMDQELGQVRNELRATEDKRNEIDKLLSAAYARLDSYEEKVNEAKRLQLELDAAKDELGAIETSRAVTEQKLIERERAINERLADLEKAEVNFKEAFDSLSTETLRKTQKDFLDLANEVLKQHTTEANKDLEKKQVEIDKMLEPMKESLKQLSDQHNRIEKERAASYEGLMETVKELNQRQSGLQDATKQLVTALQDPGKAGAWGEMVLERVVEMAGLQERFNYATQESMDTEEGKQRPDMIISLPGNKCLIIDSKVSLKHYTDGLEASEELAKSALFKSHATRVFEHARELKRRDYSKLESAPDFTVMFIPSESAFRVALEFRPSLLEDAMSQNVVLATPTTLLALLRAVAYGWRQEQLARTAQEVQRDGSKLYESVVTLMEHYQKLGKYIESAGKAYNAFGGSLETRVLPAARKFKDYGIQTNKELPSEDTVIEFSPRPLQSGEFKSGTQALPGFDE